METVEKLPHRHSGQRSVSRLEGHFPGVTAMAADPRGLILVTGDGSGRIRAWDFREGALLSERQIGQGPVWNLALCPARTTVAVAAGNRQLWLWNPATNAIETSLDTSSRQILCLQYRSGDALTWAGVEGTVLENGEAIYRWAHEVKAVAFDPAGRWIAYGGHLRDAALIDCNSHLAALALEGHRRNVTALRFNSDGALLASGSADCAVRIWSTGSAAKPARILEGHRAPVLSLAFCLENQLLASGDASGAVFVWRLSDGSLTARFELGASVSADFVAFGADRRLAAAGSGSAVEIWRLGENKSI